MGRRAFESPSLPPSQVSNHLITPLLSIIGELCRRRSELIKIIGKKDREIQDYKDQGITVSRRRQEVILVIGLRTRPSHKRRTILCESLVSRLGYESYDVMGNCS